MHSWIFLLKKFIGPGESDGGRLHSDRGRPTRKTDRARNILLQRYPRVPNDSCGETATAGGEGEATGFVGHPRASAQGLLPTAADTRQGPGGVKGRRHGEGVRRTAG